MKKRSLLNRVRDWLLRNLLSRDLVDPLVIKAQIPRSWFTKRGPGVTAKARTVFDSFTPEQQRHAVARGWFPKRWLR